MAETYDLAVIGLGALGSSTAWHAARRGLSVTGPETFKPGHERGASHDSNRILRHSYHTPEYVDDALGILRWPPLPDAVAVLERFKAEAD